MILKLASKAPAAANRIMSHDIWDYSLETTDDYDECVHYARETYDDAVFWADVKMWGQIGALLVEEGLISSVTAILGGRLMGKVGATGDTSALVGRLTGMLSTYTLTNLSKEVLEGIVIIYEEDLEDAQRDWEASMNYCKTRFP